MKPFFLCVSILFFSLESTAQYGRKLAIGLKHGYGIGILSLSKSNPAIEAKNQYFNTAIDFQAVLDKSNRLCLNIDLATTIKGFKMPDSTFFSTSLEDNHQFLYLLSVGGIARYRITQGKVIPYVLAGTQVNFAPIPISSVWAVENYNRIGKIDPNLVLGAGVEFKFMWNILLLDLRYSRSILPLYKDANQSVFVNYISPTITFLERF